MHLFLEKTSGFGKFLAVKRHEISETMASINFPKIFWSSSVKLADLSLRSKNLDAELNWDGVKDKRSLISFSTMESRGKSYSELTGKSKSIVEDKNLKKGALNTGLEELAFTRKIVKWVTMGAGVAGAVKTRTKRVEIKEIETKKEVKTKKS